MLANNLKAVNCTSNQLQCLLFTSREWKGRKSFVHVDFQRVSFKRKFAFLMQPYLSDQKHTILKVTYSFTPV